MQWQKHFSAFQKFLVDDSGSSKEMWLFSEEAPADSVQQASEGRWDFTNQIQVKPWDQPAAEIEYAHRNEFASALSLLPKEFCLSPCGRPLLPLSTSPRPG